MGRPPLPAKSLRPQLLLLLARRVWHNGERYLSEGANLLPINGRARQTRTQDLQLAPRSRVDSTHRDPGHNNCLVEDRKQAVGRKRKHWMDRKHTHWIVTARRFRHAYNRSTRMHSVAACRSAPLGYFRWGNPPPRPPAGDNPNLHCPVFLLIGKATPGSPGQRQGSILLRLTESLSNWLLGLNGS